jgi:signal transduction histidine kinase
MTKTSAAPESPPRFVPDVANVNLLLAYVADLELEVDRLRTQGRFIRREVRETLKRIGATARDAFAAGGAAHALTEIDQSASQLRTVLHDVHEVEGYHPAHDQVIAIAVRPLIQQAFRWQQRLLGAPAVILQLNLESEYLEWFPARLRHILDNLIANALTYRDADKDQPEVRVELRMARQTYEIQISDNGVGMPQADCDQVFELLFRGAPARAAGRGAGPAVVRLLVEQSGGTLTAKSVHGEGTTFVVVLPRYDVNDYLT